MFQRFLSALFFLLILVSLVHCGRRGGTLTGGPKDLDPPVLLKADPENLSINFKAKKIRLYFDEYIKLQDIQDQLIVSPPLKYRPEITPQGGVQKYVEIKIKDTLKSNTTYTLNFGQSVQDNNEGNPVPFLTYVFSTGDYIDSLEVSGVVKDAFNKKVDEFISVMLYEIDTAYTDSTLYKKPPNYITNTLDSTVIFTLKNLKEGKYAMFAIKDESKNNIFDQNTDKVAFLQDTITLPTDSTYLLTLFKEIPDYSASVPNFAAKNKIVFGYYGGDEEIEINPLTVIPDTVKTRILKEKDKDTLNFWFTPYAVDSMMFTVSNKKKMVVDTFTVKSRKVGIDSLKIEPNQTGGLDYNTPYFLTANTPIVNIDTAKMKMTVSDSIPKNFKVDFDSISNKLDFDFEIKPNESYSLNLFPGAIIDLFEQTNDTLSYGLATRGFENYGVLRLTLAGKVEYPVIVQLTDEKGKTKLEVYATEPKLLEFNNIEPSKYLIRVVFDKNENKIWDTGSFLKKIQPERVIYFPEAIDVRANWEWEQTFTITN
ncbi:Ig-like domain-containing protein [Maribacter sp. 2308TA10-17]|uniref:Ig-like domain-containing protein n=1 Tax=Maribacter sp. 2308TA10-17 TaxID=3386276 RepID=UPI0039BCDF2B